MAVDINLNLDTDGTLAADSDLKIASQKAVKTYVDTGLSGKAALVHTHVASDVIDFLTAVSLNSDVTANTAARHTHANKSLLDTYDQTNADLASAVSLKHAALTIGTANGLSLSVQALSLQLATGAQNGALSSTDWTTFNSKQADILTNISGSALQVLRRNAANNALEFATVSGGGTPSGGDGAVQFGTSSAFDSSTLFFYSKANDRLVLGHTTDSASARLQIRGVGTTTANAFYIEDGSGNQRFRIQSGGQVFITSSDFNLGIWKGTQNAATDPFDFASVVLQNTSNRRVGFLVANAAGGSRGGIVFDMHGDGGYASIYAYTRDITTSSHLMRWKIGRGGNFTIGAATDLGDGSAQLHVINRTAANTASIIQQATSQSASLLEFWNAAGSPLSFFRADSSWKPPHLADSAAANDSTYYSTTQSKMVYKDSSGVVNNLY